MNDSERYVCVADIKKKLHSVMNSHVVYLGLRKDIFNCFKKVSIYSKGELENTLEDNARLEESFQRATGKIAADPLPGTVVDREQFNRAANEIGDSIEDGNDKMAIAVFVNELEEKLFGGADE